MRQLVGFRDRSTGRGTFGGEFGARRCNQLGLYGLRVRQCREAALFPNYFAQTCFLQLVQAADMNKTKLRNCVVLSCSRRRCKQAIKRRGKKQQAQKLTAANRLTRFTRCKRSIANGGSMDCRLFFDYRRDFHDCNVVECPT